MTTTKSSQVNTYANQILAEIRHDIGTGQVPVTAASFSELHEYVDANEYLIAIFGENLALDDAQLAFENEILNEVDTRIKQGALLGGDSAA